MSTNTVRRPELRWMLDDVLLPEVRSAVVLARDGLVITATGEISEADADRFAACLASLRGSSAAATEFCGDSSEAQPAWNQTLIEFDTGYIFLIAAGPHAYMGVSTTKRVDMGPATQRFHAVVQKLGTELGTLPRSGDSDRS
ncbi:Predicted regulator of Ras-like GTPase activity, Roadblock/LC7/MglB family [Actinopolyspora xinjiangensis]|uniref:Predicted regulator of Ras-like GTPase activity, Roadblock/LC7/MglB family n=1 Tax=Actinopolyspora xinjiangensis TaxID=405564 RepID=A0A1H0RT47_9ACTN|nr:roadblock/LC7 domain-containing protein [Actinopolyspora xinjiangensis]SDP32647.1 Predicted regulator of Ras-like GTPase activity, Roadblock/LC7/MglB family [Actinopolyspora xinjiangensis]